MMRVLFTLVGVFCAAVVAAQAAGVGYLWSQGRLNAEFVADLRDVLNGKTPESAPTEEPEPQKPDPPSSEEINQARVERIFELGNREEELVALKTMVSEQSQRVTESQEKLQKRRDEFEARLKALRDQTTDEAIQQSRGVLQALPPTDAADALMGLTFDQSLAVVRGMPEKTIARILKEMAKSDDKKIERGRKLFEAITEGEPAKSLIEETAREQSPTTPEVQ